jgi:hypothetical protein
LVEVCLGFNHLFSKSRKNKTAKESNRHASSYTTNKQIKQNKTKLKRKTTASKTPLKINPRNSFFCVFYQQNPDFPKLRSRVVRIFQNSSPKFFQRLLQIQSHEEEEEEAPAAKTPHLLKSKSLSLSLSLLSQQQRQRMGISN